MLRARTAKRVSIKRSSFSGIASYLDQNQIQQLRGEFREDEPVYAWGANRVGGLDKLVSGDYVVDVKNKVIVRIFKFSFFIRTRDTRLQDWIGWDSEKPGKDRRPYRFVYFLRDPQDTRNNEKVFFQHALAQGSNQNWLVGQRWFSDADVHAAIDRTGSISLEDLLESDSK